MPIALQDRQQPTLLIVPDADEAVGAAAGQQLAVGPPGERRHRRLRRIRAHLLPTLGVEDMDRTVQLAGDRQPPTVRADPPALGSEGEVHPPDQPPRSDVEEAEST